MIIRTYFVIVVLTCVAILGSLSLYAARCKLRISRISTIVAALHLFFVILNAISIESDMYRSNGEALMGWLLFDLIDMPVSMVQMIIGLHVNSFLVREILMPIAFFGIIGTLQYLVVVEGIIRIFRLKKRSANNKGLDATRP